MCGLAASLAALAARLRAVPAKARGPHFPHNFPPATFLARLDRWPPP